MTTEVPASFIIWEKTFDKEIGRLGIESLTIPFNIEKYMTLLTGNKTVFTGSIPVMNVILNDYVNNLSLKMNLDKMFWWRKKNSITYEKGFHSYSHTDLFRRFKEKKVTTKNVVYDNCKKKHQ